MEDEKDMDIMQNTEENSVFWTVLYLGNKIERSTISSCKPVRVLSGLYKSKLTLFIF